MNKIGTLIKEAPKIFLFTMWGHSEKSVTQKRALTWHPDLGRPVSRIVDSTFLWFIKCSVYDVLL